MEGYGPIANQRINSRTSIKLSSGKEAWLEPGTYVKAIHKAYIPANHPFTNFSDTDKVAVYSQYGFGLVSIYAIDWNVY